MYQNLSEQCKSPLEHGVLALHLYTVAQGWECTGLSDDDPESSEILPLNWNQNGQLLSFRYKKGGVTLLLKFLRPSPSTLSVHGLRTDQNHKIHSVSLDLREFQSKLGSETISNVVEQTFISKFKANLLDKVLDQPKQSLLIESRPAPQNYPIPTRSNPLNQGIPMGGVPMQPNPYMGDLMGPDHPFFGQQPNPRGARWDPINPTGLPEFPDHMPPPGPFGFQDPRGFF